MEEAVYICFLCADAGQTVHYDTESDLLSHLRQVHEPGNWDDVLRSHGLSQAQLCTGCGLYWINVWRHRSTCVRAHAADEAASRVAVRQAKKASEIALREEEVEWEPSSQLSSLSPSPSPSSCHAPSPCRVGGAFQECEEDWSEGEDGEVSQAADGGIEDGAAASFPPFRRTCATPYSWNAEGTVSVSEVEDQFCRAYEEVVHWRKNIYPIPNGC